MQALFRHSRVVLLTILLCANVLIWHAIFSERERVLTVAFLDVGQGDAIFIEAPNGNQILIDGGRNKATLRALSSVIPFYDRSIDVVLATHPDADHIGGLPAVLSRYDVDFYLHPGVVRDTAVADAVRHLIEVQDVHEIIAQRGMRIILGGGAVLDVLFPDRDVHAIDPNAASIIARLSYGEHRFLFTGDAPDEIEKYVVALDGDTLKSDVLKVGHHGSDTSSAVNFLGFVSPKYGIISAGVDNTYGHPHPEVLERLAQFNIKVLSTAEVGTIVFESDGELLEFVSSK